MSQFVPSCADPLVKGRKVRAAMSGHPPVPGGRLTRMKPLPPLDIGEDRSPARPSGAASRRVAPEASNKGSSKLNTRQSEAGDPWWETLPGIVNSAAAVGSEQSGKLGKSVSFSDSAGAEAPTAAAAPETVADSPAAPETAPNTQPQRQGKVFSAEKQNKFMSVMARAVGMTDSERKIEIREIMGEGAKAGLRSRVKTRIHAEVLDNESVLKQRFDEELRKEGLEDSLVVSRQETADTPQHCVDLTITMPYGISIEDPKLETWPTREQRTRFLQRIRPCEDAESDLPSLNGSFPFQTSRHGHENASESAQFLIVPEGAGEDFFNVHLVRHFVEKVWQIPRPKVIITVTGGAAFFDLAAVDKDKIMRGMMEGTRDLSPWFITGGTRSGIMKYVGEARAKYNPTAPLIGVAPLGAVGGGAALRRMSATTPDHNNEIRYVLHKDSDSKSARDSLLEEWKWNAEEVAWKKESGDGATSKDDGNQLCYEDLIRMGHAEGDKFKDDIHLDDNHSHFLLVDNGKDGAGAFGTDRKLRAAFEAAIADTLEHTYPIYRFTADASGLKWEERTSLPEGRQLKNEKLEEGLQKNGKTRFNEEEWQGFNIPKLFLDHFVQAGSSWFVPAASTCALQQEFHGQDVRRAWVFSASCALQALYMWDMGWHHGPTSFELEGEDRNSIQTRKFERDDEYWPFWVATGEQAGTVCSALQAIWLHGGKHGDADRQKCFEFARDE